MHNKLTCISLLCTYRPLLLLYLLLLWIIVKNFNFPFRCGRYKGKSFLADYKILTCFHCYFAIFINRNSNYSYSCCLNALLMQSARRMPGHNLIGILFTPEKLFSFFDSSPIMISEYESSFQSRKKCKIRRTS